MQLLYIGLHNPASESSCSAGFAAAYRVQHVSELFAGHPRRTASNKNETATRVRTGLGFLQLSKPFGFFLARARKQKKTDNNTGLGFDLLPGLIGSFSLHLLQSLVNQRGIYTQAGHPTRKARNKKETATRVRTGLGFLDLSKPFGFLLARARKSKKEEPDGNTGLGFLLLPGLISSFSLHLLQISLVKPRGIYTQRGKPGTRRKRQHVYVQASASWIFRSRSASSEQGNPKKKNETATQASASFCFLA